MASDAGPASASVTRRVRRAGAASLEPEAVVAQQAVEIDRLRSQLDALMTPLDDRVAGVYDMDKAEDKRLLAHALWGGGYAGTMLPLRAANAELVSVLENQVKNNYHPAEHLVEQHQFNKMVQIDGILSNMVRTRSQKKVTVVAAAASLLAEANMVAEEFRDTISTFHRGALLSVRWVEKFMPLAMELRPAPDWERLEGAAVAVFDNCTLKANYGSYFTDNAGIRLDMTNWMWTHLPRGLAPNLDLHMVGAGPHAPRPPVHMHIL